MLAYNLLLLFSQLIASWPEREGLISNLLTISNGDNIANK